MDEGSETDFCSCKASSALKDEMDQETRLIRSNILLALRIPYRTARSSREDNGKRMVVVGGVGVFTMYGFLGRGSVVFGGIRGSCWMK